MDEDSEVSEPGVSGHPQRDQCSWRTRFEVGLVLREVGRGQMGLFINDCILCHRICANLKARENIVRLVFQRNHHEQV